MVLTFSVITPTFNSRTHLRETIGSVLGQCGDFAIEYVVVDNQSTDGTLEILREFQEAVDSRAFPCGCRRIDLKVISEADRGMYDALDKGFSVASGDVLSWVNADDVYLPGALATVARVLTDHEDIQWLKGVTSYRTEGGVAWRAGTCHVYARDWIRAGLYGRECQFIQQDSVFWRASLWRQAGGMETGLRLAGDYALWVKLAQQAPLVSVGALLSCFRVVRGQLSEDRTAYRAEMERVVPTTGGLGRRARAYFGVERWLPRWLRRVAFRLVFGAPEYAVVLVDRGGSMTRVSGDYYTVAREVAARGPAPSLPIP